mgnify:FL=1
MKKKYIFIFFGIIAISFLTYCFFPIIFFSDNTYNTAGNILIYDRNWEIITDKADQNWYYKFIKIPSESKIIQAIIQIEDKNYFSHYGIDIFSKIWALKTNIFSGKVVSWWSTITEQYIKNKFFPENNRSYLQKAREATLAFYYSIPILPNTLWAGKNREYLKEKIINLYAHNVYLWNNNYGLWSAIEVYFEKYNLDNLTEEEITILISLIKYPGIQSLEEKHFRDYFEKVKNKLWYSFERTIFSLNRKENIENLPWITTKKLELNSEKSILNYNSQAKYTSVDLELQLYAKDIINKTLDELSNKNVSNAAVYAMNPKTWEVLIYQASRDFYSQNIDGEFDVIQAKRQMWSTLKPFLYLLALEKWAGPESFLLDIEQEYNSFQEWKSYTSANYNLKNYWLVRLKKALWNSLNNASVRLSKELGLQEVFTWYEKFGFNFDHHPEYYGYSFVLWSPNISLESLMKSYAKLLPNNKNENKILEWNKFLLYDILSDPDNRDISFWVHSILNTSVPMAVKTGTSSNFRDNVVVSYHPDLVIWVWVGNNNNSSMVWVTGITWAGYIWHQIAEKTISLWYIKNTEIYKPEIISDWEYCLDLNCFRKEIIYSLNNKQYFSAILDNIYDKRDIFINLSENEKNILRTMWYDL